MPDQGGNRPVIWCSSDVSERFAVQTGVKEWWVCGGQDHSLILLMPLVLSLNLNPTSGLQGWTGVGHWASSFARLPHSAAPNKPLSSAFSVLLVALNEQMEDR